jgi:hypothetical protein
MRVSERKRLVEVKKRWETSSSLSGDRASCRTLYIIDCVMAGTLHERYTTEGHSSGILTATSIASLRSGKVLKTLKISRRQKPPQTL